MRPTQQDEVLLAAVGRVLVDVVDHHPPPRRRNPAHPAELVALPDDHRHLLEQDRVTRRRPVVRVASTAHPPRVGQVGARPAAVDLSRRLRPERNSALRALAGNHLPSAFPALHSASLAQTGGPARRRLAARATAPVLHSVVPHTAHRRAVGGLVSPTLALLHFPAWAQELDAAHRASKHHHGPAQLGVTSPVHHSPACLRLAAVEAGLVRPGAS